MNFVKVICTCTILLIVFTIPRSGECQNLSAYYPLNGNANDVSGNGHDGIVYGASFDNGKCIFDGINDFIDLPGFSYPPIANTGSISFWFRHDIAGDSVAIITKSTNTSNDDLALIWLSQDRSIVYQTKIGDLTTGRRTSPGVFALSAWHHFVITADGINTINFYLDGQPIPTVEYNIDSGNRFFDMGDSLVIGEFFRQQALGEMFYMGLLDDIRFYDQPLTAEEVLWLYDEFIGICHFIPGDANGDCHLNGLDVVYLVNYFKGGPGPVRRTDCE